MTSTATETDRTTRPDTEGHLGVITAHNPSGAPFVVGDRVVVLYVAPLYYSVTRITERNNSTEGTWAVRHDDINLLPQPEIGQTYTVNKDDPRSSSFRTGDRVTVIRPYDDSGTRRAAWIVNLVGDSTDRWVSTDDLDIEAGTGTTPVITPDPKDEEIARLRASLDRSNRVLSEVRSTWEREVNDLGALLMREANNRNWCSEYDEIVSKANSNLTYELPTRSKEIDITWTETYTVTVTRSATITTTDGSEESDAVSYMENEDPLDEADLISLLRENGSHEYDDQEFANWDNC
jgi:hypothetical protein